ncbi:MAG: biotin/lipoyl-containing protein [Anaerolineae bacterium]|nr:biotin/lipoyl-containing protein [Anaerolineae bacterium]MDK1080125.1 biotin/lipoyl-containing protein [Anaerolineae bacterium]MDK1117209.1 biotin/lipoyl-containing protein [Anaerolineae bacterium]
MKYISTVNDTEYLIEIIDDSHISINGRVLSVDFKPVIGQPVFSLLVDGKSYEGFVYPGEEEWEVLLMGRQYPVIVEDEREKRLKAAAGSSIHDNGEYFLKSPMPGMVITVPVEEGQQIESGQVLLILESMKMQNELKSPREGIISRIRVAPGETVEQRQILLCIK